MKSSGENDGVGERSLVCNSELDIHEKYLGESELEVNLEETREMLIQNL